MLTAKQALEIATQPNASECLKSILNLVEKAASEKKTSIRTYLCNFGGGHLYGGQPTELQKEVISSLRALGYAADVRSEERQFVDVYLEVSWEHAA